MAAITADILAGLTGEQCDALADLYAEIEKMRRNPTLFKVLGVAKCKLCYKQAAFDLGHPNNPTNAGTWCPVHGWLMFDSVGIPPTERLKPREVEENKQSEKRKAEYARKKAEQS